MCTSYRCLSAYLERRVELTIKMIVAVSRSGFIMPEFGSPFPDLAHDRKVTDCKVDFS
jgi:hypothetical protein